MSEVKFKSLWAGLLLAGYVVLSAVMIGSALLDAGFSPNTFLAGAMISIGGGFVASIAAQVGVVLGEPGTNLSQKITSRHFGTTALTAGQTQEQTAVDWNARVLWISIFALVVVGLAFVVLAALPSLIAVEKGAKNLTNAPAYIVTQAEAFLALIVAAGGAGVASRK